MAAPVVSSSSPSDGETNVAINKVLTVVFSTALDPDSVNAQTVRLTHVPTGVRESATLSLSEDGLTVTVRPQKTLFKGESYQLRLLGADTGLSAKILNLSAEALAVSVLLAFTTGDDVEAWSAEKTDETIEREGDLRLPADIQVVPGRRLVAIQTAPTNHSAGLPLSTATITAQFNAPLDETEITTDWMVVTPRPLMSYEEYLAKDQGDGTIVFSINDPEYPAGTLVDFSMPSGTLQATGEYLIWTRDPFEPFHYNCEVEVLLSPNIVDVYGNTLQETRSFVFTLEAYPMYSGVYGVERELPTLPEQIDRDLIHGLIWRNSIRAWQLAGGTAPATKAYQFYRQYVHARTCLDILDNVEIPKTVLAGQKKSIGDFYVAWDANAVGKMGLKYKRLQKELEDAEHALLAVTTTTVAIKGGSVDRPLWRHRSWTQTTQYNTSRRPGLPTTEVGPVANTGGSRNAELPGRDDGWG